MTLTANSQGVVSGKFRIPENIPTGAKRVVFNGGSGSVGRAIFIGEGMSVIENTTLLGDVVMERLSPLAQTFTLDSNRQVTGVDLWVTNKGSTTIEVQLRELENGVPSQTVLARSRKVPNDMVENQWNRWMLRSPVMLRVGVEYAIVVECDDAASAVAVAQVGQIDLASNRYVSSQPYFVGVLLSSSNDSAWTAHQNKDLAFRLVEGVYSPFTRTVAIGTHSVTNVTDLMVRANVGCPSPDCSVVFNLTLPGGVVKRVVAEQPLQLDAPITGNVVVTAVLTGTASLTPVLYHGVQLVTGTILGTSNYVSRAVPGGTGVNTKVILEAYLPGASSLSVAVKGTSKETWVNIASPESVPMEDGWVELTYTSGAMTEDMIHARLLLSGSSRYRPRCRNLRMLVY